MKVLKIKLDSQSIADAVDELEKYKASLETKTAEFVSRLIDCGISMAQEKVGKGFGKYITFSKKVDGGKKAIGFLIAKDSPIIAEWIIDDDSGETKTAEVSPLLMAEFGSGWLAEVLFDVAGVGQGTFPGQTHAFDPNGWNYKSAEDGRWYRSKGVAPTHPMHGADIEMINEIETVAREVFSK